MLYIHSQRSKGHIIFFTLATAADSMPKRKDWALCVEIVDN
jgi:hypothetical protein